ncbi:hypothetical protein E6O75_ATG01155 [Venturia nashicola]|uniref:Uncharacterized protein n=1 Tax=Venturia nashicola TaxID=86259 RepID=A0A4Z1PBA0_9PEZI|nr:hypothetical protein E6O75_ATG01155 [Venturia nashicola]
MYAYPEEAALHVFTLTWYIEHDPVTGRLLKRLAGLPDVFDLVAVALRESESAEPVYDHAFGGEKWPCCYMES